MSTSNFQWRHDGTATTFSVATPLMATIISELFHVAVSRTVINIIILLITCAVYTYSLLHGFKGISKSFIEDVKVSIGREIKSELVHYFHIDEGFPAENGQTAMDMKYMEYVTQDVPPDLEDGRKTYSFYEDFAYRVLFCNSSFLSRLS